VRMWCACGAHVARASRRVHPRAPALSRFIIILLNGVPRSVLQYVSQSVPLAVS
jgi:hypothetical protein